MSEIKVDQEIVNRAKGWLTENYDDETRHQVSLLLENDPVELTDSFYRDLEFGTGGLRGIMGVGTNRMNKYTVGMATQGLANYLKMMFQDVETIKVAISYDSRNNSRFFAQITAEVFAGNGFKVYLFKEMRPTPVLSFAVRHLNCQSGVMLTASHNPKEYNGYKAYWDDGAQLIPPHDKNVIKEVEKIKSIDEVRFKGNPDLIELIGEEVDKAYYEKAVGLSLSPEIIDKLSAMKIVYTPLHGAGTRMVPECLRLYGFKNVMSVPEQSIPDGNFPTLHSPNPEEGTALEMAIKLGEQTKAELVLATDPDADRVGIAVRDHSGKFVLLNGNQTASILLYYILKQWNDRGKLTGKEFVVKTIVTSELLSDIAKKYDIEYFDCLTGFKWIAEVIRRFEGQKTYIGGGEESYGYLIGDFVRDKDAVSACALIAETAAWAKSQGKSLFDLLIDIYIEFGFYKEKLISITKKGKSGAEQIQEMMKNLRLNPPKTIAGEQVVLINDFEYQTARNMVDNIEQPIDLPKSNVLQFFLKDGSKISARPSGTEPKIKFYFGVKGKINQQSDFEKVDQELETKVQTIIKEMNLM